ncbi:hypothetical protein MMC29_004927 [Sticta canariensis]|nr:hypothetical protein [Sticta canariensis]
MAYVALRLTCQAMTWRSAWPIHRHCRRSSAQMIADKTLPSCSSYSVLKAPSSWGRERYAADCTLITKAHRLVYVATRNVGLRLARVGSLPPESSNFKCASRLPCQKQKASKALISVLLVSRLQLANDLHTDKQLQVIVNGMRIAQGSATRVVVTAQPIARRYLPHMQHCQQLPCHILSLILRLLEDTKDMAAVRLVCKAWTAAAVRGLPALQRRQDLTIAEAEYLSKLPALQSVVWQNARTVYAISCLRQITDLSLEGSQRINYAPLQPLTQLQRLHLSGLSGRGQCESLSDLQPLPALTALQLSRFHLCTLSGVAQLDSLVSLSLLRMRHSHSRILDMAPLSVLKALKRTPMDTPKQQLVLQGMHQLGVLPQLASLQLDLHAAQLMRLPIAGFTTVHALSISLPYHHIDRLQDRAYATARLAGALRCMPQLTCLALRNMQHIFETRALSSVQHFTQLGSLTVQCAATEVAHIVRLPALSDLRLLDAQSSWVAVTAHASALTCLSQLVLDAAAVQWLHDHSIAQPSSLSAVRIVSSTGRAWPLP